MLTTQLTRSEDKTVVMRAGNCTLFAQKYLSARHRLGK
jgi:hypothetical protein